MCGSYSSSLWCLYRCFDLGLFNSNSRAPTYPFTIGAGNGGATDYFNGYISNVQVYNTPLSANGIETLYLEGIGGTPIDLQNLVGWWPLNGNANDYSGNGYNGVANSISYSANRYGGYTAP